MNTEFRVFVAGRLREEREKLGLSQADMAELGGTKSRTYQDWERAIAGVSTEFLALAALHGLDVLYVLTGQRTPTDSASLSHEESAVVDNYRHANEAGKIAARAMLHAVAQSLPVEGDRDTAVDKKLAAGGQ